MPKVAAKTLVGHDLLQLVLRQRHQAAIQITVVRVVDHHPVAVDQEYHATVAGARGALGEATFAGAWADGRTLSLEQTIAFALETSES